jgi:hypothetical protein
VDAVKRAVELYVRKNAKMLVSINNVIGCRHFKQHKPKEILEHDQEHHADSAAYRLSILANR